jgi:hypothetical protein
VDHHEIPSLILDCKYLDWHSGLVIAEDQQPIWFDRIVRRRLFKGQTAMSDDIANLVVGDSMLTSGFENPDWQSHTP